MQAQILHQYYNDLIYFSYANASCESLCDVILVGIALVLPTSVTTTSEQQWFLQRTLRSNVHIRYLGIQEMRIYTLFCNPT